MLRGWWGGVVMDAVNNFVSLPNPKKVRRARKPIVALAHVVVVVNDDGDDNKNAAAGQAGGSKHGMEGGGAASWSQ